MKATRSIRTFSLTMTLALLFAIPGLLNKPAFANTNSKPNTNINLIHNGQHDEQDDNYYDEDNYRQNLSRWEVQKLAKSNGYIAGYRHGREDRENGESFNFWHDETFRNASFGYQTNFRFRSEYQSSFRSAYKEGYSDSYYSREFNRSYVRNRSHHQHDNSYDRYDNRRDNDQNYNHDRNYNNDRDNDHNYDNDRDDDDNNNQ